MFIALAEQVVQVERRNAGSVGRNSVCKCRGRQTPSTCRAVKKTLMKTLITLILTFSKRHTVWIEHQRHPQKPRRNGLHFKPLKLFQKSET